MRILSKYIAVFVLILLARAGVAQDVNATAKLDTSAMLIGDHVGLTLKYTGPAKSQVAWPFLPDTILGHLTIIGRGKIDTVYTADKQSVTLSQQLNFTSYDSGFYTIPPIPFRYRLMPDTSGRMATTTMILLAVHTLKVDTTLSIKPIIGPFGVPITFREMLPWILLGLAVAALVFAGVWFYRKRRNRQPVFVIRPKPVVPAHERAMHEFEQLRVKKLWQNGKVKEYHSELTDILRRYIEERYQVPALEQTSSEITASLVQLPDCPRKMVEMLNRLLALADMVKFAKAQPVATENDQCLSDGISFVRETTGAPAVENDELRI